MTPDPARSAQEMLAVVAASPAAVAAHDKQRWLDLFAPDHILEDPVGSRPVLGGVYDRRSGERGNGPLSRFWDAFIAANDIVFDVRADFRRGHHIVRDATITTTMASGATVSTPLHILYEMTPFEPSLSGPASAGATGADGGWRIRRMAAHWEPAAVVAGLARPCVANVTGGIGMGARMLRHLGATGTARFAAAAFSVGPRGKDAVRQLVSRSARGDEVAVRLLGGIVPTDLTKVIAAGDTVTATCTVDGAPAVLIARLNRKSHSVVGAAVYHDRLVS
ncbi:transporter [Tsukamurella soli]|uniref:transporter n=1 Tax=Tsukamurella soli TaxID=644556 RepID=UPI0031E91170